MFKKKYMIILTMLLSVSPLFSQNIPTSDEILQRVKQTYSNVQTMSADFDQILQLSLTDEQQKSKGKLLLEKPDHFRLIYVEPENQTLISDGAKVWFYNADLEQVIIRGIDAVDATLNPLYFLTHVQEDYLTELAGEEKIDKKDCYHLNLERKKDSTKAALERMEIWVSREKSYVVQIRVHNSNNDYTTYTLKNISLNPGVKASDFQFKIPEGTEVIDES